MKLPKIKPVAGYGTGSKTLTTISIAAVISIFCLASTKVLLGQAAYKRHIVNARHDALKALKEDYARSSSLIEQYQIFEGTSPTNVIGGKNTTDPNAQPPDGNNSRIVLDALPSTYDFPALISSVSKILSGNGLGNVAIGGIDKSDSISSSATSSPAPQTVPITIAGTTSYGQIQSAIRDFERSIRPFDIQIIQFQGSESGMNLSATINTYFQPAKTLNITDKVVR